jgi:hypothetical protein
MRRLLAAALPLAAMMPALLQAEVVDRLAITVGKQSITELQLDEELRVTAFLNNQPISRTQDAKRAAADRLVEQLLIEREMDLSRYPGPDEAEFRSYIARVRSTYGDASRFRSLLRQYNLSDSVLDEHLRHQLAILRFVEYRFRSGVTPSAKDSDLQTSIDTQTDEALAAWLEESRKQVEIVYVDKSLQ